MKIKINISTSASVKDFTVGQTAALREANNVWHAGTVTKVGRTKIQFMTNAGEVFDVDGSDIKYLKATVKKGKKGPYSNTEIKSLFALKVIEKLTTVKLTKPALKKSELTILPTTVKKVTPIQPPLDLLDSKVARFLASPEARPKIKKLGGGRIEVSTAKRNRGKIAIHIPILDKKGEFAVTETGAWRNEVRMFIEFQKKTGKWKLATFRGEAKITPPVPIGKTMTDDQALALVREVFALPIVKRIK